MGQKSIQVRIVLTPGDPLYKKALLVKDDIGVKSWTEVVRTLFMAYELKEIVAQ